MSMIAGREIDEQRAANAETINQAQAAGAVDAYRLVRDWTDNSDGYLRAVELINNPGLVAWYAQRRGEFTDLADRTEMYRAGWDLGFGAALLQGAVKIRDGGDY